MRTEDADRLRWFLDAKFGLFIHWGIHSVAGVEASWPIMCPGLSEALFGKQDRISQTDYVALADKFDPTEFDAQTWAEVAVDAGTRYIVITAKHHDGFCMFDAPGTDYKITNTPFGRDVCAELADACAAAGIRLGFYYSPPDMHHDGFRDTSKPAVRNWTGEPERPEWSRYLDYMESHLRKLLTDYGDICLLWFDSLANYAKYDPPRFQRLIKELSPRTLVNDRLGPTYDFIDAEQFYELDGYPEATGEPPRAYEAGDEPLKKLNSLLAVPIVGGVIKRKARTMYRNGDAAKHVPVMSDPDIERFQPWETAMTMNRTWGFNPKDEDWKTSEELIDVLCSVNSHSGNLLLNIGPSPDGTIPKQELERLSDIGRWIRANGYRESPFLGG